MSAATRRNGAEFILDAAVEVAWAQWHALGAMIGSRHAARAIVDPEALLLLTLGLEDRERRFRKLLAWWAATGARLESVQRAKNLAGAYPAAVQEGLSQWARQAIERGKDARWRSIAARRGPPLPALPSDVLTPAAVTTAPTLMLRLRYLFGVGIKADVLTYLIGLQHRATIRAVAQATGYHTVAVRRAVEDLVAGRVVRAMASSPASYLVEFEAWAPLLGLPEAPLWRHWHPIFAFVLALGAPQPRRAVKEDSPYLASSRLRELLEAHRAAFDLNALPVPDLADKALHGAGLLDWFDQEAENLADRLKGMV